MVVGMLVIVGSTGCAPAGGPIAREDVVEIETIEMAPATGATPATPAAGAVDVAPTEQPTEQPIEQPKPAPPEAPAVEPNSEPSPTPSEKVGRNEKAKRGDPSRTAGGPGTGPIMLAEVDAWLMTTV
jgi:outer membrane biosynthesis protein TonB